MLNVKNIKDGQKLWYCKLDLHEVNYIHSNYNNKKKILASFPPNNIKCFADLELLYITQREAINSILVRLESLEGTIFTPQKFESKNSFTELQLFDNQDKNIAFNQLFSEIEKRLSKLEKGIKVNG